LALLSFWFECIKWAFWRWDRSEPLLSALKALAVWAVGLIPTSAGGVLAKQTGDMWWLVLMLPLILMVAGVAPYRRWLGEHERAGILPLISKRQQLPI
jgi:H+/Cl- antiporter ClcA